MGVAPLPRLTSSPQRHGTLAAATWRVQSGACTHVGVGDKRTLQTLPEYAETPGDVFCNPRVEGAVTGQGGDSQWLRSFLAVGPGDQGTRAVHPGGGPSDADLPAVFAYSSRSQAWQVSEGHTDLKAGS